MSLNTGADSPQGAIVAFELRSNTLNADHTVLAFARDDTNSSIVSLVYQTSLEKLKIVLSNGDELQVAAAVPIGQQIFSQMNLPVLMSGVWKRIVVEFKATTPFALGAGLGLLSVVVWVDSTSETLQLSNQNFFVPSVAMKINFCSLTANNVEGRLEINNFIWIRGTESAYESNTGNYCGNSWLHNLLSSYIDSSCDLQANLEVETKTCLRCSQSYFRAGFDCVDTCPADQLLNSATRSCHSK